MSLSSESPESVTTLSDGVGKNSRDGDDAADDGRRVFTPGRALRPPRSEEQTRNRARPLLRDVILPEGLLRDVILPEGIIWEEERNPTPVTSSCRVRTRCREENFRSGDEPSSLPPDFPKSPSEPA